MGNEIKRSAKSRGKYSRDVKERLVYAMRFCSLQSSVILTCVSLAGD